MHQPSAPTPEYGAPTLPLLQPEHPARGYCVKCNRPITAGQPSRHTARTASASRYAVPYEHQECPE